MDRARRVGSALILGILASFLTVVPAHAICANEQAIFIRTLTTSAKGTTAVNKVRDSALEVNCQGSSEHHSTAHMRNMPGDSWAEMGWWKTWTGVNIPGWLIFWETGEDGLVTGYGQQLINCCHASARWRVNRVSSAPTKWVFYYDLTGSGPWIQFGPTAGKDVGFQLGYSIGETGIRPDTPGTSAYDHFWNMQYLHSTGWVSWNAVIRYEGCITDYDLYAQPPDEWQIVQSPYNC